MIHLLKKIIKKYSCHFTYKELYVIYKTMLKTIIDSIFSFNNLYKIVDNNSNYYKSFIFL